MGENSYTVYRHTTPSGKSYIGITSKNVKMRSALDFIGPLQTENGKMSARMMNNGWR